jgi:hypothetical protein
VNPSKDPVAPSRPDLNETTIGSGGLPDTVPVRAVQVENKARMCVYVTERWTPSPEERKRIAEGADVYLTLVTGDGSPMPVQLDAGEPDWLIYGAQPGCCERHVRHVQRNHIIFEGDDGLSADLLKVREVGGTETEDSRVRPPASSAVDRPAPFPCPQCGGVLLCAARRLWCIGGQWAGVRATLQGTGDITLQSDRHKGACGYQTEGVEAHNVSPRCPKDGAQLLTDGLIVWCSNVDSRTPCDYFSA